MLIQFSVENFRSIQEEQTLSMVASAGSELRDSNTFDVSDLTLTKSAVIYGPNASGKSNVIKALDFMHDLVLYSSKESQEGEAIDTEPYLFDVGSRKKPSSFEVIFVEGGIRYQYGFTVNQERVCEEWLYSFPHQRMQRVFERTFDKEENTYVWHTANLKGQKELIKKATRDNALFLSTAVQLNNEQLKPVFHWFRYRLRIAAAGNINAEFTASLCSDPESNVKQAIVGMLQAADLTISDIEVKNVKFDDDDFPQDIPESIRKRMQEKEYKEPVFLHPVKGTSSLESIPFDEESDGTVKLFELAGPWLDLLSDGLILLIDELDRSLHPLLVKFLIDLIHDNELNTGNGQLIFTTHNTSILHGDLFRRDQVWFVQKDKFNASTLYPLTKFSPRKDEALEKGYFLGRYGALPSIGELRNYNEALTER